MTEKEESSTSAHIFFFVKRLENYNDNHGDIMFVDRLLIAMVTSCLWTVYYNDNHGDIMFMDRLLQLSHSWIWFLCKDLFSGLTLQVGLPDSIQFNLFLGLTLQVGLPDSIQFNLFLGLTLQVGLPDSI